MAEDNIIKATVDIAIHQLYNYLYNKVMEVIAVSFELDE